MIKSGYVMAVMANGRVLEEDGSNKVCLPFGTEYTVRLINKNYDRCAADLIINGDKIARFVLSAGETADIERYVDDNLHGGSRFKFTHLNDGQVKDKNSFENGLIEVLYYKEKYKKPDPIIIREDHWHDTPVWPKYPKPSNPWNDGAKYMMSCNTAAFGGAICNNIAMAYNSGTGMEGATVRGSRSNQQFQEVSGIEFESTPVIVRLKIVNGELQTAARYCVACGRKRNSEKYCSNCGTKY